MLDNIISCWYPFSPFQRGGFGEIGERYNRVTMVSERTQQIVYFEEVLPSVFHDSPGEFLFYLERDGNKFLRFYWDKAGMNFPESTRVEAFGLNYLIREPQKDVTIALVLLPAPQVIGEAFFEALIYRPRRVTPILRISDMTSVFALTMAVVEGGVHQTNIIERTRKDATLEHGVGPAPVVEDFYQAVLELIRDSRGNL